jgi:leucyl-tRNA synthetase
MTGHNVLHTMGFDASVCPPSSTRCRPARTRASPPRPTSPTSAPAAPLGLGHDPRRSIATTDVDYYRWTQWIFLHLQRLVRPDAEEGPPIAELVGEFESGARATPDGRAWAELAPPSAPRLDGQRLVYSASSPVNWCPGLGTVLANEEVTADGRSDRGNFPVFRRNMRQWMMRITAYADRLLDDLDLLDWPEPIKAMQRNWIGRSTGAQVHFATRRRRHRGVHHPPRHAVRRHVHGAGPRASAGRRAHHAWPEHPGCGGRRRRRSHTVAAVAAYRAAIAAKTDVERQRGQGEDRRVHRSYATNPVNGEQVPGLHRRLRADGLRHRRHHGGAGGDQRDFEFARTFGLPIVPPSSSRPWSGLPHGWSPRWRRHLGRGLRRRRPLRQLRQRHRPRRTASVAEGKAALINEWLESHGRGEATITYKLRDWLFSRQRYWGEPFPIVYDERRRPHALPDSSCCRSSCPRWTTTRPARSTPTTRLSNPRAPLGRLDDWVTSTLDLGDGPQTYRRDTNVMPQWAGSCWYELRYSTPPTQSASSTPGTRLLDGPASAARTGEGPGGVDLYVGGVEHAVLHLLYARFWHKVLFDLGHVSSPEPFHRLFNQGYIQAFAYTDARGMYVEAPR